MPTPSLPPDSLRPRRGGLGSPLSGPCTVEAPCWQGLPLDESQKLPREGPEVLPGVSPLSLTQIVFCTRSDGLFPLTASPQGRKGQDCTYSRSQEGNEVPARRLWAWGSFLALRASVSPSERRGEGLALSCLLPAEAWV
uniref:Uncharacterized protein n=1 Tax=Myotis myotis TaxID=51298 RepID=A0A7J7SBY2_MYOMY|nr:hypothetical protein mMyoMyo1_009444 [Myotis myotis]